MYERIKPVVLTLALISLPSIAAADEVKQEEKHSTSKEVQVDAAGNVTQEKKSASQHGVTEKDSATGEVRTESSNHAARARSDQTGAGEVAGVEQHSDSTKVTSDPAGNVQVEKRQQHSEHTESKTK